MAKKTQSNQRVPIGPTGRAVCENLKKFRQEQGMSFAELSRQMEGVRPIAELGLRRMESGARRMDVDDLVCLAAVLGVTPNDLLGIHVPSDRMLRLLSELMDMVQDGDNR